MKSSGPLFQMAMSIQHAYKLILLRGLLQYWYRTLMMEPCLRTSRQIYWLSPMCSTETTTWRLHVLGYNRLVPTHKSLHGGLDKFDSMSRMLEKNGMIIGTTTFVL